MRVEMVDGIVLAHPFNCSFDKVHYCSTDDEAAQVATGETIRQVRAESTNLQKTALSDKPEAPSAAESKITVYTSTFYIGLVITLKDGTDCRQRRCLNGVAATGETRKLDISWPSQEFYDICRHSPGYNEDSMNVSIKHIRKYRPLVELMTYLLSFDLPDDVFYDGQTRPTKEKKKAKKRGHAAIDSGDIVPNLLSTSRQADLAWQVPADTDVDSKRHKASSVVPAVAT